MQPQQMFANSRMLCSHSGIRRSLATCRYLQRAENIARLEESTRTLSDQQLAAKTAEFRARLKQGQKKDDILEEAFAVVREASCRVMSMRHYPVQLVRHGWSIRLKAASPVGNQHSPVLEHHDGCIWVTPTNVLRAICMACSASMKTAHSTGRKFKLHPKTSDWLNSVPFLTLTHVPPGRRYGACQWLCCRDANRRGQDIGGHPCCVSSCFGRPRRAHCDCQ